VSFVVAVILLHYDYDYDYDYDDVCVRGAMRYCLKLKFVSRLKLLRCCFLAMQASSYVLLS
jgi:hypothetical protein